MGQPTANYENSLSFNVAQPGMQMKSLPAITNLV
jgi:hypothetical protein